MRNKKLELLKRILKNSIKINATLDLLDIQQDTIENLVLRITTLEKKGDRK